MQRKRFRELVWLAVTTILVGHLLTGCAGTSRDKSLIRGAREFAKAHGVDAEHYSGTVTDRGDDYFILFTRKAWPRAVGEHFGVFVNKQTGEYALDYGR